jgi:hypothetical protein
VSPSERRLWHAVQRRAAEVSPLLAAAILRAFARLRDEMDERALARAIALGFAAQLVDELFRQAVIETAMAPVRQALREGVTKGVRYYTKTLPPKIAGELSGGFDILSPHVVPAIRTLESRVLTTLSEEVRETVRAAVTVGLEQAKTPASVAKGLREVIGLAPNQVREVENFRLKLEHAHERSDAFDNVLRDRRFDATLTKARKSGVPLSKERIDTMVNAYRKRRIAQHAETVARTAALDAQKLANRLAWETAIEQGSVDRGSLMRTWRGVMDDRERPTHVAMEGDTVPFDVPHRNGQMVPGESEYRCRCIDVFRVA